LAGSEDKETGKGKRGELRRWGRAYLAAGETPRAGSRPPEQAAEARLAADTRPGRGGGGSSGEKPSGGEAECA